MRRSLAWAAALSFALAGCDPARGLFVEAGRAEAEGRLEDAVAGYAAVCSRAPSSPLCAQADARSDRLIVRLAAAAIAAGRFAQAKPWIEAAAGSKDPVARDAAARVAASPDFVQGLAWLDAAAKADRRAALPAVEAIAAADVTVSADAAAWIAKNRPAILLEDVAAACVPSSPEGASCVRAARKLASLHPRSPEAAAARKLVEAEYRRMYPALREIEELLIRAVPIGRAGRKAEACENGILEGTVAPLAPSSRESIHEVCEAQAGMPDAETVGAMQMRWSKAMVAIRDDEIFVALNRRWNDAVEVGDYAPHAWPPPAPER